MEEATTDKQCVSMGISQAVADESISLVDRGLIAQIAGASSAASPFGEIQVGVRGDMVVALAFSGVTIERLTTDQKGYGWWLPDDEPEGRSALYPWIMHYQAGGSTMVVGQFDALGEAVVAMCGVLATFNYARELLAQNEALAGLANVFEKFASILDVLSANSSGSGEEE